MLFRNLTINDLDFALNLTKIENWGTTREELEDLILNSSKCALLATIKDKPVGMIFTVSYNNFGFIGNLIVKKEFRNQGIGKQLMQKAISHLEDMGNSLIMLDGVEAAVGLYQSLGFKRSCKSLRMKGKIMFKPSSRVFQMKNEDFQDVLNLDRRIFQADREFLLRQLFTRYTPHCKIIKKDEKITGFIMAIPKEKFLKIGPWIVDSECEFEPDLLVHSLKINEKSFNIQLGMLESNKFAVKIAEKCKLQSYSYSNRMIYNSKDIGDIRNQFKKGMLAIGGPDRG
ncbi:GNAT family N-acetyltransferase [Promethearchaeum syntrophicum]|uniref:GNAT family N-acetyltransferase n=1 Tax=Promethearchaeum syntrophicum TaxID=2594042 RepID=A0A5B9D6Y2_9ARCH|nr:GNAT family N-acetyltransferase [Candidatus Prometheoarchaeum syntrophicum]QEE14731.1 putative acetyltransferase [Candidatus Prometheoarchaeum syntrophicum]